MDVQERVGEVRGFNRFFTRRIGVLGEGILDSPYSLTEVRVLFELAQRDAVEVTALRRQLGLDPGYLSRILARFDSDGLVDRQRSTEDGRRQVVRLTEHGRAAFAVLDTRSSGEIAALLDGLGESDQRRLVAAMRTIRDILGEPASDDVRPHLSGPGNARLRPPARGEVPLPPPGPAEAGFRPPSQGEVRLRPPGPGDLGWVVQRHGALYAQEYGWDQTFEALVARIVADYGSQTDVPGQRAWIAEVGGEPVGSVFCTRKDDRTAQLRLLLVEPSARSLGVGSRLVAACVDFARQAGYERMVLWTNDVLHAARRLYQRAGFVLVAEDKHHSFGHDLTGQHWSLDLTR